MVLATDEHRTENVTIHRNQIATPRPGADTQHKSQAVRQPRRSSHTSRKCNASMHRHLLTGIFIVASIARSGLVAAEEPAAAIEPRDRIIRPFNGKDLSGFTPWLRKVDRNHATQNYAVANGTIHISGEGMGYLATVESYQNYHLSIDYKWGQRTDGSKFVRNSGILLHATGPAGNARGVWMASIEVQLAQGCEGDLIVIRGKDEQDAIIPVRMTSDTVTAEDGRTRWKPGGTPTPYSGKQFWWSRHEVGFRELLDTRGQHDVASPLGEWTNVECICDRDRITVKINGQTVNECYNVFPAAGRILLENEKNEIYFRNFELRPLSRDR